MEKTIRQFVYNRLRRKVISAEVLPGEVLSFRQLAREFGVSLMPIREAVWQLESEGVLKVESNRGIHVNVLTAEEMKEILMMRLMLEPIAAEKACERRPDAAVTKLKRTLEGMEASADNSRQFMSKNSQFHFGIYGYARLPATLHVINWLWARIGPYLSIQVSRTEDLSTATQYHRYMFDAFAERDTRQMVHFLKKDLKEAAQFIIQFLASRESKNVDAGRS